MSSHAYRTYMQSIIGPAGFPRAVNYPEMSIVMVIDYTTWIQEYLYSWMLGTIQGICTVCIIRNAYCGQENHFLKLL